MSITVCKPTRVLALRGILLSAAIVGFTPADETFAQTAFNTLE